VSGCPEEVLKHPAVADDGGHGLGPALLLGKKGMKAALPTGRGFVEVGDGVHGDPFFN